MSRPASELTIRIRELLDQTNGEITHAQARVILLNEGFELAADKPPKSENFSKFDEYQVDLNDQSSIDNVLNSCGFTGAVAKAVVDEALARAAFAAESSGFNVTKNNWKLARESGKPSTSTKPASSKNTKAKTASGRVTLKTKRTVAVDVTEALATCKEHGGVAATQELIRMLQAAVDAVVQFQQEVADAA